MTKQAWLTIRELSSNVPYSQARYLDDSRFRRLLHMDLCPRFYQKSEVSELAVKTAPGWPFRLLPLRALYARSPARSPGPLAALARQPCGPRSLPTQAGSPIEPESAQADFAAERHPGAALTASSLSAQPPVFGRTAPGYQVDRSHVLCLAQSPVRRWRHGSPSYQGLDLLKHLAQLPINSLTPLLVSHSHGGSENRRPQRGSLPRRRRTLSS